MRYFLSLAYDGTNYHGWQIQPNAITVQEVMNESIGKILRQEVNVVGCGRTDTGVHASYYVLHFDMENPIADFGKFLYKINAVLPSDISVFEIHEVDIEKHARFDAFAREYHYFFTKKHHPFLNRFAHRLIQLPDVSLLQKAAQIIRQNTDFESFCKAHAANKTNICHVSESEWIETEDLLIYRIKADRFLRNMVRALTGTMLEIGLGKRNLDDLQKIFDAKDRSKAGMSVEPEGLFLTGVWYEGVGFEKQWKLPFNI
jgi:tRNA pseudouridine38-40 synthase